MPELNVEISKDMIEEVRRRIKIGDYLIEYYKNELTYERENRFVKVAGIFRDLFTVYNGKYIQSYTYIDLIIGDDIFVPFIDKSRIGLYGRLTQQCDDNDFKNRIIEQTYRFDSCGFANKKECKYGKRGVLNVDD